MNYTKSGIIACGSPFSRARFLGEAKQGIEKPQLLLLTDEGRSLADRFFRSIGCAPLEDETRAEILNRPELFPFLCGVTFALEIN